MDYNLSIPVNLQTVSTYKNYSSFSDRADIEFDNNLFYNSEKNYSSLCTDSYYDIALDLEMKNIKICPTLRLKSSYNNMFSIQRKHHDIMINSIINI